MVTDITDFSIDGLGSLVIIKYNESDNITSAVTLSLESSAYQQEESGICTLHQVDLIASEKEPNFAETLIALGQGIFKRSIMFCL